MGPPVMLQWCQLSKQFSCICDKPYVEFSVSCLFSALQRICCVDMGHHVLL